MPKTRLVTRVTCCWALVLFLNGCNAQSADIGPEDASPSSSMATSPTDACSGGMWFIESKGCVLPEEAYTSQGGQTYWVDQSNDVADDLNSGTRERPWRTIGRATTVLRAGDAVIVESGIYREAVRPRFGGTGPDRRITYAAAAGADVVISGADAAEAEEWRREGNVWRRVWTGPELPMYSDARDNVMRRELVVVHGEVLMVVFRRDDVVPGTFFVEGSDTAQQAILARFQGDKTPSEAGTIEVAHRTVLFQPTGENLYPDCGDTDTPGWLHVVGFTFRHATNRAQWGAFCAGSEGSLVEDVTVEWTNGAGVDGSGLNHIFRHVAANNNGQIGFVAACDGCLFEDTEAIGNNWKGYDPFWEAGGGKWHNTHQTVIRRHTATDNRGPGIWLDGNNSQNTIESSVALRNDVAGIMIELQSTRTLVQHNLVVDNRWRGYSGAGILSQAASRNAFVHNTVVRNEGGGIWIRLDPDRRAEDGHNVFYNNLIVSNAWTSSEVAREISVEGSSFQHSRSNRFEGNVYGRHQINDLRTSTFFFHPSNGGVAAGFRSGDLTNWQQLTRGDATARLIDSTTEWPGLENLQSLVSEGAPVLPESLLGYGADASIREIYGHPGADPDRLPSDINLGRR